MKVDYKKIPCSELERSRIATAKFYVVLLGCLVACQSQESGEISMNQDKDRQMSATRIDVEWSSQYSGKLGMSRFLECIGEPVTNGGGDGPGFSGIDLPKSLVDLLGLANERVLQRFNLLRPSEYARLREFSRVDYDVFMIKKGFKAERHLDYSSKQDPAKAATGHFAEELVVIGKEDNGSLYLLNPLIRTSDGEWEAWLYSWRLPGAYRFPSFAELLAHLYQESLYPGKDNPRFGFSIGAEGCVRRLMDD